MLKIHNENFGGKMEHLKRDEFKKYMFMCKECGQLFELQQTWAMMEHFSKTKHNEFTIVKVQVVVDYYMYEDEGQ